MSNLTELTAQIVAARAARKDMSTEEFQQEMLMVYSFLKGVEEGNVQSATQEIPTESKPQKINFKQIFKKDEVICLICNKGFKTLKRHLFKAHQLKPGEYKKQYNIPAKYSLIATAYSEERKKAAIDRGQGGILAKAREARAAKKAAVPAIKVKAPVPAVRVKAAVPAVKIKAAVPAKVEARKAPVGVRKSSGVKSTTKSKK
jgi:predicted transcriptional regulator